MLSSFYKPTRNTHNIIKKKKRRKTSNKMGELYQKSIYKIKRIYNRSTLMRKDELLTKLGAPSHLLKETNCIIFSLSLANYLLFVCKIKMLDVCYT